MTHDAPLHGIHATARLASKIVSFGDAATEAVFHGEHGARTRRIPRNVVSTSQRKVDMLNAAVELRDLLVPPGNRLEALRGVLRGLHSIRVNDQWRLVFRWTERGPAEVRLIDYH
jgi:proteic killer suppression protein